MKKFYALIVVLGLLAFAEGATAQLRTSYFMEGSYFRTELNPALVPTRGYLALPGMSGVGVGITGNYLSIDNLIYERDGQLVTGLHSSVSPEDFLSPMPNDIKLSVNANVNLLGVGFYAGHSFWSFGLNVRSQNDMSLSKDMFSAIKTLGNGVYDLSSTALNSNSYLEAYLGSSFRVCPWVNVGIKAKFLVGVAHLSTDIENMSANVDPSSVTAQLRGMVRANSIFFDRSVLTPGANIGQSNIMDMIVYNDPNFMLNNAKSFGGAIDLGAEFRLFNDHLKISAAVTDLGFIRWSANTHVTAQGSADFGFGGMNIESGELDSDMSYDFVIGELPTESFDTRLNCSLNVGVEYNFLRNHMAIGVLSHTEFCNSMRYTEVTASLNLRPCNWLSATASHTFVNNEFGIFGVALNIHPRVLNIFVGADFIDCNMVKYGNIPLPRYAKSFNVYAGVGFNFARPRYMRESRR